MVPDPEYTVRKVEVWRVFGPDGQEVMAEDDEGREYPLDFDSYECAFQNGVARMQCCVPYGPKTKAEQAISDSFAQMAQIVNRSFRDLIMRDLMRLPSNSDKTIQFIRSA